MRALPDNDMPSPIKSKPWDDGYWPKVLAALKKPGITDEEIMQIVNDVWHAGYSA